MSTALTARTIAFLTPTGNFDQNGIMADASIVSATDAAFGKVLQTEQKQYFTEAAGVYTSNWTFELIWFVTPAVDTNIVAGIPALAARWPGYQVVTWSSQMVYGT